MDTGNDSYTDGYDANYMYSPGHRCWIKRNETNSNVADANSTYCYYGLSIVIPISTVLVTTMILAIVGNSMVILTILRHRGMRTRTNLLLGNLAVADILVAVLDMPISLVTIIKGEWIFSFTFCDFNGFTVGLGFMLSIHTLMWISIHKYISITRPFSRSVTLRKIMLMILIAWLWAILYNLTPTSAIGLTDTKYKLGASQCGPVIPKAAKQYIHSGINTVMNLLLPITIMTCCYYRIFREVKDHLNRMREFADQSACSSLVEQKQITVTLCIVLSVFILFWMPYIAYSMSLVFLGKEYVPVIFNPIAYMFGYMNSACNPIIYALRSPSFRKGFQEIICGNDRRGFPGSIYGRQDSVGNMGRWVDSFRRSIFRNGSDRKLSYQARTRQGVRMKYQPPTNVSLITSGRNADLPKDNAGNILYSHKEEEEKDTERKISSTSNNMSSEFKINIIQGVNKYTVNASAEGLLDGSSDQKESDLQKVSQNISISNIPQSTKEEIQLNNDVHIGIQVTGEGNSPEKNHVIQPKLETEALDRPASHDFKMSKSQPNIALLPSHGLNIWVERPEASSNNHDIVVTTLEIKNNQIRSVSVGDVSVTCNSYQESSSACPTEEEPLAPSGLSPRQLSKVKHQFVWQPSVENFYGSPMFSRRKHHLRRMAKKDSSISPLVQERKPRDNVAGASAKESPLKSLFVPSIIQNFKRSLTDLLHTDDDALSQSHSKSSDSRKDEVSVSTEGTVASNVPEDDKQSEDTENPMNGANVNGTNENAL